MGGTPWCIGLGAGAATGGPAADRVEELVRRMSPPDAYDRRVTKESPFDDPAILATIEEYGWFEKSDAFAIDRGAAQGEILTGAESFRFDGSDLMPDEIGASAAEAAGAVQNRRAKIKRAPAALRGPAPPCQMAGEGG